jgi:hypothetical protein
VAEGELLVEDMESVAAHPREQDLRGLRSSDQALPPYAENEEPGVNAMTITQVATMTVDETGEVNE